MSEHSELKPLRCLHLSCKSMVVFGEDFESDPDYQAGMTDFWCTRTQTGRGPDNDDVCMEMCSNPERGCYQEY
ncbi:MAG: hypothetical protein ACK4RK_03910 [Gemmataceae bacterium]